MFWFGSTKRFPPSFKQRIGSRQIEISIDQGQTFIQIVIADDSGSTYLRKIMKTDLEDKKEALTDLYEWLHLNEKELIIGDNGDVLIPAKKGGKMTKIKTHKQHNPSSKIQERLSQLENTNYLLAEEIRVKDKKLTDFEQKIFTLSNVVKVMQSKLVEMGEEINRVKQRSRVTIPRQTVGKLGHHQDNLHQHHFVTKSSGANSLLVRKIGNKGYYDNFINYLPIEDKERVIYKLRLLKLAEKALWLGLGTKAAFGDVTNQSEVCLYSCWNGDVWEGRAMRKTGIQTGTGEELHLLTDRLKNKIAFLKQGRVIAEIDIPSNIGSKNLFLFLQIRDIDDEVQVSQEQSL